MLYSETQLTSKLIEELKCWSLITTLKYINIASCRHETTGWLATSDLNLSSSSPIS